MPTVSTLMSTYAAETASHLSESLESVFAQTQPPDQLVLVVDGPIPSRQEDVIQRYSADRRIAEVALVRLTENAGLATAMNAGLEACEGEFTMRMDSGEVSSADRLNLQLSYAISHPDVDVISSWSEEFFDDGRRHRLKVSPIEHEHVTAALRWRNVLVHSSVLIKTKVLKEVGGYRSKFGVFADYDLFVRLALNGFRFHVIPKALLRFRLSDARIDRRRGWRYTMSEVVFRLECRRAGFLRLNQFLATAVLYPAFRLVSAPVMALRSLRRDPRFIEQR